MARNSEGTVSDQPDGLNAQRCGPGTEPMEHHMMLGPFQVRGPWRQTVLPRRVHAHRLRDRTDGPARASCCTRETALCLP